MKKIILAVIFIGSLASGQVSSRTSNLELPQWAAGNKLNAGTENDTAVTNDGLNNGFSRLDYIVGRYITETGRFRAIGGDGAGNLVINAGLDAAGRVSVELQDSLLVHGNLNVDLNALIVGNLLIGGYLTVDSLLGNIHGNSAIFDTLTLGTAGTIFGALRMYDGAAGGTADYIVPNATSGGDSIKMPGIGLLATMATTNGHQNFTDVGTIVSDGVTATYLKSLGGLVEAGDSTSTDGSLRIFNSSNGYYVDVTAPNTASSNKTLTLPNVSGTVATVSNSDSLQSATIFQVLYNSPQVAGAVLDDTSAAFTEWTTDVASLKPIVRLKYVHRAGVKYIKARFYAKTSGDGWEANVVCGSLTGTSASGVNASYGSSSTATLDVSGLTANTLYNLTFNIRMTSSPTAYFKELIITSESN